MDLWTNLLLTKVMIGGEFTDGVNLRQISMVCKPNSCDDLPQPVNTFMAAKYQVHQIRLFTSHFYDRLCVCRNNRFMSDNPWIACKVKRPGKVLENVCILPASSARTKTVALCVSLCLAVVVQALDASFVSFF